MNDYQTDEMTEIEIARKERDLVEITRGDLRDADTYFLSKLIQFGTDAEKACAGSEWERRVGKPFPYHPSYDDDSYLTAHGVIERKEKG